MSGGTRASVPDGYLRHDFPRGHAVVLRAHREAVVDALRDGTLHAYGERHPRGRPLQGRVPAFAVPLPDGARVVIRHSTHGGLLAPLTRDRFLPPTRAPRELAVSRRLAGARVATPEVVAYAVYRAGPLLRTSDVVTREVPDAIDLGEALVATPTHRHRGLLPPVAELLRALQRAGAIHPDLNVKNVLLAPRAGPRRAYVLDVDRVVFRDARDPRVMAANLGRLRHSARRWRERRGASLDERELDALARSLGVDPG